jgi:hypothetical protein
MVRVWRECREFSRTQRRDSQHPGRKAVSILTPCRTEAICRLIAYRGIFLRRLKSCHLALARMAAREIDMVHA